VKYYEQTDESREDAGKGMLSDLVLRSFLITCTSKNAAGDGSRALETHIYQLIK
jgi:hypothetical protein